MKKILVVALAALFVGLTPANAKGARKSNATNTTTTAVKKSASDTQAGDFVVYVRGRGVRIRATPSLNGKVVGHANWGDSFWACGYVDGGNGRYGWYKIYYGGRIRYISAQFSGT